MGVEGLKSGLVTRENYKEVVNWALSLLEADIKSKPNDFLGKFEKGVGSTELIRLMSDSFKCYCLDIVYGMVDNRAVMEFDKSNPLTIDDVILHTYEAYRRVILHRNHYRDDGVTSYCEEHLDTVTKFTLILERLCGNAGIIASHAHDDVEDMKKFYPNFEYADLLDPQLYINHLKGDVDEVYLEKLMGDITQIIEGLTKIGDSDAFMKEHEGMFKDSSEATFYQLFVATISNIRSALIKCADRLHNLKTVGTLAKRKDLSGMLEKSERVYMSMARIFGIVEVCKQMVDVLAEITAHDGLWVPYHDMQKSRIETRFSNPVFADIRSRLVRKCPDFVDCNVEELGIEKYIENIDKKIRNISIGDLGVPITDPMAELVVTVGHENSIKNAVTAISSILMCDDYRVYIPPKRILGEAVSRRADSKIIIPGGVVSPYDGVMIDAVSKKFGGYLRIRVTTEKNEYLRRRGVLGETQVDLGQNELINSMKEVVAAKDALGGEINLMDVAEKKFLGQKTYFLTPNGDTVVVPAGSTYHDAAVAIHSDILIGVQSVSVSKGMTATKAFVPNLSDPLPIVSRTEKDKPVLNFDSCLDNDKKPSMEVLKDIKVTPKTLNDCTCEETKKVLREYLSDPMGYVNRSVGGDVGLVFDGNENMIRTAGINYLNEISDIVGKDIHTLFVERQRKSSRGAKFDSEGSYDDISYGVGTGEIDPLTKFEGMLKPFSSVDLEIRLPSRSVAVLTKIYSYFADGLSAHPTDSKKREYGDIVRFSVTFPTVNEEGKKINGNINCLKLLRALFHAREEGYDLKITSKWKFINTSLCSRCARYLRWRIW